MGVSLLDGHQVDSFLGKIKYGTMAEASMSEADIAQERWMHSRISHPMFTF
jgi:hypothetical protein